MTHLHRQYSTAGTPAQQTTGRILAEALEAEVQAIHNNRLLQLAREGQKTTPQHLRRFDALHRHATLVAYLSERAGSLADEALDMHDSLVCEMLGKGEKARDENFRKRGKAINEKVGLYASMGMRSWRS